MKAFSICLCVAALVLGVGACSSGGAKRLTSTTTAGATTTTARTNAADAGVPEGGTSNPGPTGTPSSLGSTRVTINIGPCPSAYSNPPTTLNAGVAGLDKKMVPVVAANVRVCVYRLDGRLQATGAITGVAVASFEDETNQLPTQSAAHGESFQGCVGAPRTRLRRHVSQRQTASERRLPGMRLCDQRSS